MDDPDLTLKKYINDNAVEEPWNETDNNRSFSIRNSEKTPQHSNLPSPSSKKPKKKVKWIELKEIIRF